MARTSGRGSGAYFVAQFLQFGLVTGNEQNAPGTWSERQGAGTPNIAAGSHYSHRSFAQLPIEAL